MNMKNNFRRRLLQHLAIVMGIAALVILDVYRCPVLYFLHIPCPACGITRAWLAAFRMDFISALRYHPLFLPTPFFVLYYIHREKISKHFRRRCVENIILIAFAVSFFTVYILRLTGVLPALPLK